MAESLVVGYSRPRRQIGKHPRQLRNQTMSSFDRSSIFRSGSILNEALWAAAGSVHEMLEDVPDASHDVDL